MARSLDMLYPKIKDTAVKFQDKAKAAGIPITIVQTVRTHDEQQAIWDKGRTAPGADCVHNGERRHVGTCKEHPMGLTVSNSKPGDSIHEYRMAIDIAVLKDGRPTWDGVDALYMKLGPIGESCGFEWGGRWPARKMDMPHYQMTFGLSLADLKAGKTPNNAG